MTGRLCSSRWRMPRIVALPQCPGKDVLQCAFGIDHSSEWIARHTSMLFPSGFMMEQPSFWDRNHDMNTIQEAPYACMFLFRGGSRGLDSPAPDDSNNETCIHLRTLVSHETIGVGSLYSKVDDNKMVFPDKVPRQHIGFRETRRAFVLHGEIRESGASPGGFFAGTPFCDKLCDTGSSHSGARSTSFAPWCLQRSKP